MGLLDFLKQRKLYNDVTCIATRNGSTWRIQHVVGHDVPDTMGQLSLDGVVAQAERFVVDLYRSANRLDTATLQMAIYPWSGSAALFVYAITHTENGYVATESQGGERSVEAASLDKLIEAVEEMQGNEAQVTMLRWDRSLRDLRPFGG